AGKKCCRRKRKIADFNSGTPRWQALLPPCWACQEDGSTKRNGLLVLGSHGYGSRHRSRPSLGPRGALRPCRATHEHHVTVTACDLGIDPFQDQYLAVEAHNFAIVGAGWNAARAHVGLALGAAFEGHILHLRIVVAEHPDAAGFRGLDRIRLRALAFRRDLGTRAILVAMICCEA